MRPALLIVIASMLSTAGVGCGRNSSAGVDPQAVTTVSIDASKYMLAEEPDGAVGVIAARDSAQDGEAIVVVGRIGGAANPWIEGRAAFMLLDASMLIVADGTDSADGEICMDDCCAVERSASTTLVKIVDERGQVLTVDTRQLLGVAANDMVVIRGRVSKDASGNFVVLADGVHVRR